MAGCLGAYSPGGQCPGVNRGGRRSALAGVGVDVGRRGGQRPGPADQPPGPDHGHGLQGGQGDFNDGSAAVGVLNGGQQDQPLGPAQCVCLVTAEAPAIVMDGQGQGAAVGFQNHGVSPGGSVPGANRAGWRWERG